MALDLKIFGFQWKVFCEAVQTVWNTQVNSVQPFKRLHIKLARTIKGIKNWKKSKIGDTRLQLAIVKDIILRLETAQEERTLTQDELDLLKRLKVRSIGLALIEKARIRQRSCLTSLTFGLEMLTRNSSSCVLIQGRGKITSIACKLMTT